MVAKPHWPPSSGEQNIVPGLERIKKLLHHLGDPHRRLPPVIHVAGTNGKGSTVAFLRSLLQAGGYRVHVYTSPHLVAWNERIVLAGVPITDAYLWQVHERCRVVAEANVAPVSYFEAATAAALLAFSEVPADVVILEVGMGGRWDATNVIPNPAVTVITPVSMDHAEFLGDTVSQIAGEKSGIQRSGVPTIVAPQSGEALEVILAEAARLEAHPLVWGRDWHYECKQEGFSLCIEGGPPVSYPQPSLRGLHQIMNASVALVALDAIAMQLPIAWSNRRDGLLKASWPGRISRLAPRAPGWEMLAGCELWADGAHNAAGAQVLGEWIRTQERAITLVIGCSRGRSVSDFLRALAIDQVERIIVVTGESRGITMSQVPPDDCAIFERISRVPYRTCQSLRDVLPLLSDAAEGARSGMIVVTGSLYLVGELYSECDPVVE